MTASKNETSPSSTSTSEDDGLEEAPAISAWTREGEGNGFTPEAVVELLEKHGEVWGVKYVDFADYVQAIPQTKSRKVRNDRGVEVAQKIPAQTLYMSVAGRLAMLNAAAEKNGWQVDIQPEPVTPTGIPGVLQMEDAIVYRVYVVIHDRGNLGSTPRLLGSKPGQAWVPGVNNRANAAASNPWEKVETAAHGRAIAAWGIGVLPGSGVASAEEVQGAAANERAAERQAQRGPGGARQAETQRETKLELVEQAQQITAELCTTTGTDIGDATKRNADWLNAAYQLDVFDETTGGIFWERVNQGQALQLRNYLRGTLQKVLAAGQGPT